MVVCCLATGVAVGEGVAWKALVWATSRSGGCPDHLYWCCCDVHWGKVDFLPRERQAQWQDQSHSHWERLQYPENPPERVWASRDQAFPTWRSSHQGSGGCVALRRPEQPASRPRSHNRGQPSSKQLFWGRHQPVSAGAGITVRAHNHELMSSVVSFPIRGLVSLTCQPWRSCIHVSKLAYLCFKAGVLRTAQRWEGSWEAATIYLCEAIWAVYICLQVSSHAFKARE